MNKAEFIALNAALPPAGGTPVFIYALLDPKTLQARYIGKSTRPIERLANHMNDGASCHRTHWLRRLREHGLRPEIVILERIDGDWPWQEAERFWIAYGKACGWPLTNNTSGGDGVCDLPPATRRRMADVWIGRKHKPESVEKIRAASAARRHGADTRALMSAAHKGRSITWGDTIADALRKLSDEQVEQIRHRLAAGHGLCALAAEYGVHRTTLSKIKKGTYGR